VKASALFWTYVAAFGLVVGAVYWFLTYEDAGTAMLLFMGAAGIVIGGYIFLKSRTVRLIEDDPNATHADATDEEIGHFSSGSIWPIVMAVGVTIALLGFVFGRWMIAFGAILFVWSTVGLMQESRG
jgi:hypothetical protein